MCDAFITTCSIIDGMAMVYGNDVCRCNSTLFQSLMRAARDDPGVVGQYRAVLAGGAAATCTQPPHIIFLYNVGVDGNER